MTDVKGSILGNAVLRREDPTLLTGEDKYFDDMEIDGLGFVYFARSPVAHANIISIETSEAKEVDGVVGVWTPMIWNSPPISLSRYFRPTLRTPLGERKGTCGRRYCCCCGRFILCCCRCTYDLDGLRPATRYRSWVPNRKRSFF